jgi:hypothetical protein
MQKLTTCSLTPRSGEKFLEHLARSNVRDPHRQLYEEAKLALCHQDLETAVALFEQCPSGYENRETYLAQVAVLQRLSRGGIVRREQTESVREFLADVLHVERESRVAGKFAELLNETGFTRAVLEDMTLRDVDALFSRVSFPEGFRKTLESHFAARTGIAERMIVGLSRAVRSCGIERCIVLAGTLQAGRRRRVSEDEETADE